MMKTILNSCSLNRVKDVLDGDSFGICDIPVFILWGFIFLLLVVIGIGSIVYALAIPIIALASYDAGKLCYMYQTYSLYRFAQFHFWNF